MNNLQALLTLGFIGTSIINLAALNLTNLDIYNNYTAPIRYAINSTPSEAISQFKEVAEWMEVNHLDKGNTCVFIKSNPRCNLSKYYNGRIVAAIKNTEAALKDGSSKAISDNSIMLHEIFLTNNGKVSHPINLNLYMRYGDLSIVGWFIDASSGLLIGSLALQLYNWLTAK